MENIERRMLISYSGIFLTWFLDQSETCVHSVNEHTLIYVYSGEQVIEDRGVKITVKGGQCAFIRRNHRLIIYKNSSEGELFKGIALTFKRRVLRELYSKLNRTEIRKNIPPTDTNVFMIEPRPDIESLFQSLTPYFNARLKPSEDIIHLKLLEGIYTLLNISEDFFPVLFDFADPWKVDILEFLNENFTHDLTLEQIASFTGRSLATFKRDFKKISNLSPQKWIIRKRLEAAYSKLQEANRKVQDVYLEVGFKNQSHFSAAFKKQYGVPPGEINNM